MALRVTLIGGRDREVETLLRSAGVSPSVAAANELLTLGQPTATQPDAIVLDLRDQPSVPAALAALKRNHPTTGVVIVASTLDPELILAAMRAGANECLAEPLSAGELDAAITRVVARGSSSAGSQLFAVVGAKGGVGTTSLAVNVATALARVASAGSLLVDLHIARGDAALYLGVEPRFSVVDALENTHKLDVAFFGSLVTKTRVRLDLLAAPENGASHRLEAGRIKTLFDFTSKHFEFTVVDLPRTEPAALDALDAAKKIVVVTTQELSAVRSAVIVSNRLRQRYGKDRVLVVASRHDKQAEIQQEDLEKAVGGKVAHVFPSDFRLTSASLNRGQPLVLDNHSELAASVESFARTLAGLKTEKKQQRQESSSWRLRLGLK